MTDSTPPFDVHRNRLGLVRWTLWGDQSRDWLRAIGWSLTYKQAYRAMDEILTRNDLAPLLAEDPSDACGYTWGPNGNCWCIRLFDHDGAHFCDRHGDTYPPRAA